MRLFFRVTDASYRQAIANGENNGRVPIARVLFGNITGRGWGFLRPWEQLGIFPGKGTPKGAQSPLREHEPFVMVRLRAIHRSLQHPNMDWDIEGMYWTGYAWRRSWGPWWRLSSWRRVLLDPHPVYRDPGVADDWGNNPDYEYEDW